MTTKEFIETYHIIEENGKVGTYNAAPLIKDGRAHELAERKAEILAYFAEQRRIKEEWDAKVARIEGLAEIRKAQSELEDWRERFNASFDGEYAVGGLGVGRKPQHNISAMLEQYPRAAAYLKAEQQASKENIELREIGKRALNEVVNGDYKKAMETMQADIKAFVDRHIWD